MLPGIDGLEICRRARAMARYTPIIITSARSSEVHRILGLELGADDYLAKPFSMLELVARVKALLRRVDALARNRKWTPPFAPAAWPSSRSRAKCPSMATPVTSRPGSSTCCIFFARQPGKVFSRMDLLNRVWGYSHEGYEHTVNTHINRLRAKIEADPANPRASSRSGGAATSIATEESSHEADPDQRLSLVFAVAAGVLRHVGVDAGALQPDA